MFVLTLFSLVFRYGSGTLTKVFVDRVFQECLTYDGEMVSIYNHEYYTVAAPFLWNSLPLEVKSSPSLNIFKSKLKTFAK